jgi:hypothetical protein
MPDELDHEVIDSPQALFRHLYEAHGVIEALDLDPDTAPLQFWLRRHSELERAAAEERGTARATPEDDPAGESPPVIFPESAGQSTRGPTGQPARGPTPAAEPRHSPSSQAQAAAPNRSPRPGRFPWRRGETGSDADPGPAGPGPGSGPRFRPFADPLVEAVAAALVGRGLDERRVRRGLSTFTGADRRHGEEAVRATFIVPMLDSVAAQLAGHPQNRAQCPPPTGTPSPESGEQRRTPRTSDGAGRERIPPAAAAAEGLPRETAPPGAEKSLIAQPLATRGTGAEPDADFMAIADVLQERRRSRRGGPREATAARASGAPATGRSSPDGPDDDVMALADAIQQRRAGRPPLSHPPTLPTARESIGTEGFTRS